MSDHKGKLKGKSVAEINLKNNQKKTETHLFILPLPVEFYIRATLNFAFPPPTKTFSFFCLSLIITYLRATQNFAFPPPTQTLSLFCLSLKYIPFKATLNFAFQPFYFYIYYTKSIKIYNKI